MNGFQTLSGAPPPIIFPDKLTIGDTWCFELAAGNYGADPWTGVITFASGPTSIANTATLQNGIFYWVIPPTDTQKLPAGALAYSVVVSNPDTTERYTLQGGICQAQPNLSDSSTPVPTQTMLQQQLAACDATLLQLLSQRTEEVTFGGKAYRLWDIAKLWAVRNDLYQRVQDELGSMSGNSRGRIIIPVFKNPWGGPYPSAPWYPYGW